MSDNRPWYIDRPWCCRWCGNVMLEHTLYYAKGKRREFCNFRCLHDFKNFMERLYGKRRLKAIINKKNKTLMEWVELIPFLMIERQPMKPIANHVSLLIDATDDCESDRFVQIEHTKTKEPDNPIIPHGTIKRRCIIADPKPLCVFGGRKAKARAKQSK